MLKFRLWKKVMEELIQIASVYVTQGTWAVQHTQVSDK